MKDFFAKFTTPAVTKEKLEEMPSGELLLLLIQSSAAMVGTNTKLITDELTHRFDGCEDEECERCAEDDDCEESEDE
jgi:TusA-related sulfurtransferase